MTETYKESNDTDTFVGMSDMLFMVCLALVLVVFLLMLAQGVGAATASSLQTQLENVISQASAEAVQHERETQEFAQEIRQLNSDLDSTKSDLAQNRRELEKTQASLDKAREAEAVAVSIAVDCTGSMQQAIADLNRSIELIAESMPKALRSFKLGIVCYRDGETIEFPIQEIFRRQDDGGASINELRKFIQQIKAEGGSANIDDGLSGCMRQLDSQTGARQCLMLLGDVAPGELPNHTPSHVRSMNSDIKSWANDKGRDRRILALYTGNAASDDRVFYEELATVNDKCVFGTSTSEMFRLVFEAAFSME